MLDTLYRIADFGEDSPLQSYAECLAVARQSNLSGDHLSATRWLAEAHASRIEYLHGPVPLSLDGFKAYLEDTR